MLYFGMSKRIIRESRPYPGMYIPFFSAAFDDTIRPVIRFFGFLLKAALFYAIVMMVLVIWYAFQEPSR